MCVQYFATFEHQRLRPIPDECMSGVDGLSGGHLSGRMTKAYKDALKELEEYLADGRLPDAMGGGEWPEPVWRVVDSDYESEEDMGDGEERDLPWRLGANGSIVIERLGRIEYIRPGYHSARSIHPIGCGQAAGCPAARFPLLPSRFLPVRPLPHPAREQRSRSSSS